MARRPKKIIHERKKIPAAPRPGFFLLWLFEGPQFAVAERRGWSGKFEPAADFMKLPPLFVSRSASAPAGFL
jgi:hypothetical protein